MPIISNFPTGSGGSGGGLTLGAVSNIQTLVASEKVYIKWTDPEDIVLNGATLAGWAGTILVRKAGSVPSSRRDGTIVIDSTVRDAYSDTYFCDSGLSNDVTYYYKFFSYTTSNAYTDSEDNVFAATPTAIAPADVSGISTSYGNAKINLKWTDPDDTVTDGITVSKWAGTKVVYKTGSYPTSPDDGTLAINSTTKNGYQNTALTISGLTNGTTYYIALFPYSSDGAVNTNASNRITATPNRIAISTVPSQSGSLTYSGSAQSPTWSNYDSTKMTLGGTTSGTNAGSYDATFTPLDDYCWSDGTTAAKTVSWSIGKAAGSLSISPTSITLNASTTSKTITVTRAGDGAITAESSNTSVATVSVSGTTVTVKSVNSTTGTATITIKVAAGTNHTAPSNKTCAVTASFKPTASTSKTSGVTYTNGISDLDADTISLFAEAIANNSSITNTTSTVYIDFGSVHRCVSVGDQITLSLGGTDYVFNIIGFNHDSISSSDTSAYSSSTGKAGITFQMDTCYATTYAMNSSNTNSGGWSSSNMRTSVMATMKGLLPTAWQSILRTVSKISGVGGGASSGTQTTADQCFLLAEGEIFGSSYGNSGSGYSFDDECAAVTQYAWYAANNTKVKTVDGSANSWWERSPSSGNSGRFCSVGSSGSAYYYLAYSSFGVSFGFCV